MLILDCLGLSFESKRGMFIDLDGGQETSKFKVPLITEPSIMSEERTTR